MAIINMNSIIDRTLSEKNSAAITWDQGNYLNATFCVTEECNLECTYCYMVGKNNFSKMSFDMAKKIVDFLLNDSYCVGLTDNLMVDFIGGEPLLEMELIDKISDYLSLSLYVKKHKWFDNFQISFSTNGTLYDTANVEKYLNKHRAHCGFGFSIDGTKEKHDLSRKTRDGNGSYERVIKGFEKYKKDFGEEIYQKSTFSSDDLIYLKDSIIHLWDLGFKNVESNLVYEDVWKEGDSKLFEQQLKDLADYMFESGRYLTHTVAYFEKRRGLPLSKYSLNQNRCGAGYKSLAFDFNGNIYPCIRFLDMCAENKVSKIVGNISDGIDYNALRTLCGTSWNAVSDEECRSCCVGTDCGWCVAQNYQENGTAYKRVKAICEMHKANAKANQYFWTKYERIMGRTSARVIEKVLESQHDQLKYVYFITSDDAPLFCNYKKQYIGTNHMSHELYKKGLDFCIENEVLPIFLGEYDVDLDSEKKIFFEIKEGTGFLNPSRGITVTQELLQKINTPVVNYVICKKDILVLTDNIKKFYEANVKRVNIFISDIEEWDDEDITVYKKSLDELADFYFKLVYAGNLAFQINILSDRLMLFDKEIRDCAAGINSVSLAPNGKFYACPGFYFTNPDWSIGTIETGIENSEKERYFRERSPMCSDCKADSCHRCLLNSKIATGEVNVPSSNQCRISYIQANTQKDLYDRLIVEFGDKYMFSAYDLPKLDYVDYVANMIYNDERAIAKKWMY